MIKFQTNQHVIKNVELLFTAPVNANYPFCTLYFSEFGTLLFNVKVYQDDQDVADISINICYHSKRRRRCDAESRSSKLSPTAKTK